MITPDDNGYGRVKRWREKNRALANLRQREYRRKTKGGDAKCQSVNATKSMALMKEAIASIADASNAELTVRPAGSATIQGLRELITKESGKPVETPVAVPTAFRDDYGRVISEAQWRRLQERKKRATEGGYEIDAYSQ